MKYIDVEDMMRSARFGVRGRSVNEKFYSSLIIVCSSSSCDGNFCRLKTVPQSLLHFISRVWQPLPNPLIRKLAFIYYICGRVCKIRSGQSPYGMAPVLQLKPAERSLELTHKPEGSLNCLRYHRRTIETCQTENTQYREYLLRQHFSVVEAVSVPSYQRAHAAKVDLRKGIVAENNLFIFFHFWGGLLRMTGAADYNCFCRS
jgi:hypothetical protein